MTATHPRAHALIERIESLSGFIREQADIADRARELPQPLVDAFHEAGLFRMYVPEKYDGLGLTPPEILPVVEAVARIDASVAWSLNVGAGSLAFAALLTNEQTKAEIFATPRGSGAGTGNPTAFRINPAVGGYRVTGRAGFATSVSFATHVAVGGAVLEGGAPVMTPTGPRLVFGLVPVGEVTVLDTWDATGLRGTGSHEITLDDVFIPDSRTFNLFDSTFHADDPYSCVPLLHRYSPTLVAVAIGAAQHAIDAFIEMAGTKVGGGDLSAVRDRGIARIDLARAMGLVGAARTYCDAASRRLHDLTYGGRPVTVPDLAAHRLALVTATAQAAEATDIIRVIAGTTGMSPKSPIDRCWRDAHAVQSHAGFGTHNLEKVGMVALGMEPPGGI